MPSNDTEFWKDIFSFFGEVTFKKMFGGLSLYHQNIIFAIVTHDTLWLKGDVQIHENLMSEGAKQWVYIHKNTLKTTNMPYYSVPESALDDPDEMAQLAKRAFAAALRVEGQKKLKVEKLKK
jgi:DNA transformation protein and related proteins